MDAVSRNIHALLSAIKKSSEYREYRRQEEILNKDPELAERVSQFRAANFRMQNEGNRENLFHMADDLARESAELRRNAQVNAYLDAEFALCRLMQQVCRSLIEGIDISVPRL